MNRIFELDALRGLSVAMMIIVDAAPEFIYQTLQHSEWEGINLADTVFPAFVFVMGASAVFSTARRQPSLQKIFRRAGLLFFAGFLLNILMTVCFELEYVRVFGVLQRLALTYLFGMLILLKLKSVAKISAAAFILLVITSAGFHIYAPDAPFAEMKNISSAIDFIVPGANYIYEDTHDPEGLYGVMASTASMLFGVVAGKFLMQNERRQMFLYGAGILICGYGWSYFDMVAKKIWTTPFALLNAGGDMIFLAALGILFETVPLAKKLFRPFDSLGRNPLIFFMASNIVLFVIYAIEIENVPLVIWLYRNTFQGIYNVEFSTLLFCVAWCALWVIPAEILRWRNIVFRF